MPFSLFPMRDDQFFRALHQQLNMHLQWSQPIKFNQTGCNICKQGVWVLYEKALSAILNHLKKDTL